MTFQTFKTFLLYETFLDLSLFFSPSEAAVVRLLVFNSPSAVQQGQTSLSALLDKRESPPPPAPVS